MGRVIRPGDGSDEAALDAAYWARIPVDERAEAAWQLSLEMWRIAEPDVDHERGLSRCATGRHKDLADAEALELLKK